MIDVKVLNSILKEGLLTQFFRGTFLAFVAVSLLAYVPFALADKTHLSLNLSYEVQGDPQKLKTKKICCFKHLAQATPSKDSTTSSSTCTKADFESAVDKAADILRDLNSKNKPHFHDILKLLKEQKGWSQEDYEKEAIRFVKDDEIDKFDGQTSDVLAQITAMGDQGSISQPPDCNLLQTLQTYMNHLIEIQTEKWTYIFKKIDAQIEGK